MNMQTSAIAFLNANENYSVADDLSVYQTLLESTKAIPWKIDWATMTFAYIGPQIEALLGWEPSSWKTVDDWVARMHEDDRDFVVNFCVSQSQAGIDHEADYRALTKDNEFVWIRDVVHVVRDAKGEVESLVGFMLDISERKKAEQELAELQQKLEALSFEDGLTKVANRRKFDFELEVEWNKACSSKKPLSLILCDIDFFKQYNDFYGHVQGDECLKKFADVLNKAAQDVNALAARFGGEEFVILLPETDCDAARNIASQCNAAMAKMCIPHEKSYVGTSITASISVGSIIPPSNMQSRDFIKAVDQLLYAAKQNGRNRIEFAEF